MNSSEKGWKSMRKNWTFPEVRKTIIDRRLTYGEIAKRTGYSPSRISDAINGRKVADKVKRAIAFALDRTYEQLWTAE